ncbi:MAG: patatin-like phospholipase family protein [Actinomycetota bacterium]
MTSVGLVLGAGGLAGYAYHAAALAVLQRMTGWDPRTAELIVGTSAGSNVGAILRGNVPVGEALDRILTVPTNPRSMARLRELSGRVEANPTNGGFRLAPAAPKLALRELSRGLFARPSRVGVGLIPAGRLGTEVIGDRAAELHHGRWPDETLWIPAVRLSDGERVVFGRDRLDVGVGTASEASSAIPGFFRPVAIDGDRYIDGGVHSPTNADLVVGKGFDLVVIVSPMSGDSLASIGRSINGPLRAFCKEVLRREVRAIRNEGTDVLVVEPNLDEIRSMGPTLMDPTRVLNTVLQTSNAARLALTDSGVDEQLDLLRLAASEHPSPRDVSLPE